MTTGQPIHHGFNRGRALFFLLPALLILLIVTALVVLASQDCTGSRQKNCVTVLFIGNSYTYTNDLPGMFAGLARAGKHRVLTQMEAPGGWGLADHVKSSQTLKTLNSPKWDYVVLQEQSVVPAFAQLRSADMYPAARLLVAQIRQVKAAPIFFLTWAHRGGVPEYDLVGYGPMQDQIDTGYQKIAQELNVPIAPAGYAWWIAMNQNPQLDLWQADGSHPNPEGTYLAACVFYAVIFRESPEGLSYIAGIPRDSAKVLQKTAADVVLKNPKLWNLR
jgi:hypothetical protein